MWINVIEQKPPSGYIGKTKIDDGVNVRNEQELKYVGKMWWLPDMSMYVYYTPTHWWAPE